MKDVQELSRLMKKVISTFGEYERDLTIHDGWVGKDKLNEHSKIQYLGALSELVSASLPHESNAIPIGEIHVYQPVGMEYLKRLLNCASIQANGSLLNN